MDLQPLFWQELSHNKDAMRAYAALSQEGKAAILGRVNKIHSLPSMQLLVASLDEREAFDGINEYE